MKRRKSHAAAWLCATTLLLAACAATEPPPRWQVDAANASERFVEAWLGGDRRVEQVEFDRARERVARTGRADLVARIELLRCAARIATLMIESCTGYNLLKDALATGAESAYADYLAGMLSPTESARIALLPAAQRAVAALAIAPGATENASTDVALASIEDPLSQLVAAGVLLRTGRATDGVIAQAVNSASQQGWRRALLAWLTLQKQRAEAAGDAPEAQRAQRRIELIAPQKPPVERR